MTEARTRSTLRRVNPFVMLAVGILVGTLITALAKQPADDTSTNAATTSGEGSSANALAPGDTGLAGSNPDAVAAPGEGTVTTITGGAAPATGPAATSDACAGSPPSGVQGVTDKAIKIGYGVADLSVLPTVLGPQIDPGDIPAHANAVLAQLRKEKRLPVCGRDIVPVFRKYSVLDPAQSRSACVGWAEQDKVFAVLTEFAFTAPDCVTVENKMVLLNGSAGLDEDNFRSSPLLFGSTPPPETMMRSLTRWIVETGVVQGKKIGVYYNSAGTLGYSEESVKKNIIELLAQLGNPVTEVVATDNDQAANRADPNDAVAVQRFKTRGIQVAIVLINNPNFYQQADAQDYKAQWVAGYDSQFASDAVTKQYPAETFDGALGLQFNFVGEGRPLTPEAKRCYQAWNDAGHPTPQSGYAEDSTLRQACDILDLFTRAITAAGKDLTTASLVAGMESLQNVPMAISSQQTFGPGRHWGATANLPERYFANCTCWRVTGPWRPLYSR